jgi:hypothetical protein
MDDESIRDVLNAHWHASAVGDLDAEHAIYDDNAVCDYPQSGERILGRANLQALRSHHPGRPSGFNVRRMIGLGDLWITEYTITYEGRPAFTVSIMRRSTSQTLLRRQVGGASGFSRWREAECWLVGLCRG